MGCPYLTDRRMCPYATTRLGDERPCPNLDMDCQRVLELEKRSETLEEIDTALRGGADEELWPPGMTRGEAIHKLIYDNRLLKQELEATREQLYIALQEKKDEDQED